MIVLLRKTIGLIAIKDFIFSSIKSGDNILNLKVYAIARASIAIVTIKGFNNLTAIARASIIKIGVLIAVSNIEGFIFFFEAFNN